jgi:hypothetical protein
MVDERDRMGRAAPDGARKMDAVARILIVGGGCRGRTLAGEMLAAGHAVRVSTRGGAQREIEASGAECFIGTPARLATLRAALDGATLACWLLASARGGESEVRALHGSRLQAFVRQLIDTTVRGFIYEAAGTVPAAVLAEGERSARALAQQNAIPMRTLTANPADLAAWLQDARAAIDALLEPSGRAGAARDARAGDQAGERFLR